MTKAEPEWKFRSCHKGVLLIKMEYTLKTGKKLYAKDGQWFDEDDNRLPSDIEKGGTRKCG